jgi:hypothetical protein
MALARKIPATIARPNQAILGIRRLRMGLGDNGAMKVPPRTKSTVLYMQS